MCGEATDGLGSGLRDGVDDEGGMSVGGMESTDECVLYRSCMGAPECIVCAHVSVCCVCVCVCIRVYVCMCVYVYVYPKYV